MLNELRIIKELKTSGIRFEELEITAGQLRETLEERPFAIIETPDGKKAIYVLAGHLLVDQSPTKSDARVRPLERAYPALNKTGKTGILLMRNEFADIHTLGINGFSLPVRITGEYPRFITVEVRPHVSETGRISAPYNTSISKHDFWRGRVLFVEEEHDLYSM